MSSNTDKIVLTHSLTHSAVKMLKSKSFFFWLYFPLLLTFPACSGGSNGGVPAQELWCVAKNNAEDAALQAALDWACGAGGADCGPIQGGGPCYDASSVQNTASYAFNDYFRSHGITNHSCNFDNNAAVTSLNPSHHNCKFPSSLAVSNVSFSGSTSSMGLRPGEDISGCSKVAWRWWFWPSIISHFLLVVSVSRIVSG